MTELVLTSLEDLLNSWGPDNVERLLRTFKCERDPEVEEFLIKKRSVSMRNTVPGPICSCRATANRYLLM